MSVSKILGDIFNRRPASPTPVAPVETPAPSPATPAKGGSSPASIAAACFNPASTCASCGLKALCDGKKEAPEVLPDFPEDFHDLFPAPAPAAPKPATPVPAAPKPAPAPAASPSPAIVSEEDEAEEAASPANDDKLLKLVAKVGATALFDNPQYRDRLYPTYITAGSGLIAYGAVWSVIDKDGKPLGAPEGVKSLEDVKTTADKVVVVDLILRDSEGNVVLAKNRAGKLAAPFAVVWDDLKRSVKTIFKTITVYGEATDSLADTKVLTVDDFKVIPGDRISLSVEGKGLSTFSGKALEPRDWELPIAVILEFSGVFTAIDIKNGNMVMGDPARFKNVSASVTEALA